MDEDFLYNDFESKIYRDQYTLSGLQKAAIKCVFVYLIESAEEVVKLPVGTNTVDTAVFSAVGMACYSGNTSIILTNRGNEGAMTQKVIDVCRMASVRIKKIESNIVTVRDMDGDKTDVCVWSIDQIDGAVAVSDRVSLFNFFVTGEQTAEQTLKVEELGKSLPTFVFQSTITP